MSTISQRLNFIRYSVSERWRMAALTSICDNCILAFDYSTKAVEVKFPAWPAGVPHLRVRKNSLVKRVFVSVPLWKDMCDGGFCEAITRPQYEGVVFPAANTLVLNLSKAVEQAPTHAVSPRSATASISATTDDQVANFSRSLRRLTPSLTDVAVYFASNNGAHSGRTQLYRALLSEVYRGGVKKMHVYSDARIQTLRMQVVTGLTSITQGSGMGCSLFAKLAYHNSGTLKELSIRPVTEADWLVILYNDKETPAVFDSLTSLVLKFTDPSRTSTWTAIKDVEPFPVLSTLKVNGGYPFNDDLLFRGNGAMMQHLRLPFCAIAINALGRFGVLKRGSVTRMNSIRIGVATNIDKAHLARRADKLIEYQVHCMLEVALALHLSNDATDKPVYGAVKAAPSTAILQNLEFGSLLFSTAGMTSIISRLPSLVSFTCKIGGLGASIKSILASDRLSTLRAKHYPLSSNFRKLCVPYTANVLADQIAGAAMLIAVLCPNFVHVDISPKLRDEFSREIAWASCNRSFQPYAESLRRLIYMDPDH